MSRTRSENGRDYVRLDGNPSIRKVASVKTIIDIPDAIHRKAKIRAVKKGVTLEAVVLMALERELQSAAVTAEPQKPYFARRKLVPEFARLQAKGAFQGGPDSTGLISEGRDAH